MTQELKDSLQQMSKQLADIRREMEGLIPAMNELTARNALLRRQYDYLNSSIMNLESYLTIEKGDPDAN